MAIKTGRRWSFCFHHLQSYSLETRCVLIFYFLNWTRLWLSSWSPWTESWDNNIWWYYIFNDDCFPMYYNGRLDRYYVFCKWCSWLIDELGLFYLTGYHRKFFHVESGKFGCESSNLNKNDDKIRLDSLDRPLSVIPRKTFHFCDS